MQRKAVKFVIDLGLIITFLLCFVTGVILYPGFVQLLGISFRALPTFQITMLHNNSGLAFGVLAIVHFLLNWRWMVAVTRTLAGRHG
jgi:hypothetical protein